MIKWTSIAFVLVLLVVGCHSKQPDMSMVPHGPTLDAVYKRLGYPDRWSTTNNHPCLEYDLSNGQILAITVDGNGIAETAIRPAKELPNKTPEHISEGRGRPSENAQR